MPGCPAGLAHHVAAPQYSAAGRASRLGWGLCSCWVVTACLSHTLLSKLGSGCRRVTGPVTTIQQLLSTGTLVDYVVAGGLAWNAYKAKLCG